MKPAGIFTVCAVLLSVLLITACGWEADDRGSFEYRLQGIWETNNLNSDIFVILTITRNSITIEDDSKWYVDINDPKHPFKDFAKNVPLKGYSEKINENRGTIYIEQFGILYEVPYEYDSLSNSQSQYKTGLLRFTFPSPDAEDKRWEILTRVTD